jgi:hypothetical protein
VLKILGQNASFKCCSPKSMESKNMRKTHYYTFSYYLISHKLQYSLENDFLCVLKSCVLRSWTYIRLCKQYVTNQIHKFANASVWNASKGHENEKIKMVFEFPKCVMPFNRLYPLLYICYIFCQVKILYSNVWSVAFITVHYMKLFHCFFFERQKMIEFEHYSGFDCSTEIWGCLHIGCCVASLMEIREFFFSVTCVVKAGANSMVQILNYLDFFI